MPSKEVQQQVWWVIEFETEARQEDLASWLMMQLSALGCEIEPGNQPDSVRVRATFEVDALPNGDISRISAAMEEYWLGASISTLRLRELQEEDWLAKWKVGFEPFPVGDKLLVCPAWLKDTVPPDQTAGRAVILVEPGLAFGTGYHATTRFCLTCVEKFVPSTSRILDVGTGSGILAIGAALLNSKATILAIENDPKACSVARENFDLNQVSTRISLLEGTTDDMTLEQREPYDLILSNLTYEDNTALLPDYIQLMHSGSRVAFAGILKEKHELMVDALETNGFRLVEKHVGDMWAGLVAEPK